MDLTEPKTNTARLYRAYIIAGIILFLLLFHIFSLLLGEKSLIVLLELRKEEERLNKNINFYKNKNASLQKEIFELIGE